MSTENDLIIRNQQRAIIIQRWCLAGLIATILVYLAFHLWFFELPEKWYLLNWYGVTSESGISQRALDWALWGLIGTFIYLLTEITFHYREIAKNSPIDQSFLAYTPWYVSTLLKGPFTVLVIMLFINAANLNLTGIDGDNPAIAFNFSALDHRVSVAIAFVLGYYGRVGRQVLDGIVKSLLPKAWAETHENFEIKPGDAQIVLGESTLFNTSPKVEVVWAASLGTIEATGKYTAPVGADYANKTAVITATSTGAQRITKSSILEILPFKINIEPAVDLIEHGKEYTFLVPADLKVDWTATNGDIDTKTGKFIAGTQPSVREVTITAVVAKGDLKGSFGKLTLKYKESDQGKTGDDPSQ